MHAITRKMRTHALRLARKLRNSFTTTLRLFIVTVLLSATIVVIDTGINPIGAQANTSGQIDNTFTPITGGAQSIAAFSDSSIVVGYGATPFVRLFDSNGATQAALITAYATSNVALEVDRSTNRFYAAGGNNGGAGLRVSYYEKNGTLISRLTNSTPQTSSGLKLLGNSLYVAGSSTGSFLSRASKDFSNVSVFSTPVGAKVSAVNADSLGRIYTGIDAGLKRLNSDGTLDGSYTLPLQELSPRLRLTPTTTSLLAPPRPLLFISTAQMAP